MDVRSSVRELPPDSEAASPDRDTPVHAEQVSLSLQQIKQTQQHLEEMETRLADLTRDCAAILEQWSRTDERHSSAVAALNERLGDWTDLERRLLTESATRLQQFERNVLHEWHALRQKHEEPILRLDAQATRIAETCVSAVDAALRGFHGAEARRAAFEQDLVTHLGDLAREVRGAVQELRRVEGSQRLLPARPWAMEEVVKLHGELRADDDARAPLALVAPEAAAPPRADVVVEAGAPLDPAPRPWSWRMTLAAAAVAVTLLGGAAWLWSMSRDVSLGLRDAAARAEAAQRGADEARRQAAAQVAAAQAAADARIETAQQTARAAQLTASVLSAPDLIRFDLAARSGTPAVFGNVLWSRTRGIVLNSAWLPPLPEGHTYQLWIHSVTAWTSAGTFGPEATGHVDIAFDPPASLPRPVIGARVTIEPAGGAPQPTGTLVIATRPPARPDAPAAQNAQ
jgi:Anti-sigma-K factor rskA